MTDYKLEREYKIKNTIWASTIRISPTDGGGVSITGITNGPHSIEEANAIAHAILHCIEDIQHFQRKIDEKLLPEPIPDRDGWIEHDGRGMPVPKYSEVEIEMRCGEKYGDKIADWWHHKNEEKSNWFHDGGAGDIVRYRVVS